MTIYKRKWLGRLLRLFPSRLRDFAARRTTPNYVIGAMCRLQRDDGRILLVKPTYRNVWTLPGGLTDRGEAPIDCMQRELREETGMRGEIVGEPTIVVDLRHRVVDFVYHARVPADLAPETARAVSLEIGAVGWFAPDSEEALTGEFANRVLASETAPDAVRVVFAPAKSKGSTGRRRQ